MTDPSSVTTLVNWTLLCVFLTLGVLLFREAVRANREGGIYDVTWAALAIACFIAAGQYVASEFHLVDPSWLRWWSKIPSKGSFGIAALLALITASRQRRIR